MSKTSKSLCYKPLFHFQTLFGHVMCSWKKLSAYTYTSYNMLPRCVTEQSLSMHPTLWLPLKWNRSFFFFFFDKILLFCSGKVRYVFPSMSHPYFAYDIFGYRMKRAQIVWINCQRLNIWNEQWHCKQTNFHIFSK